MIRLNLYITTVPTLQG